MDNLARKWTICAFALAAGVAAVGASKPASVSAKAVSTKDVHTLSVIITPAGPVPPQTYCNFTANVSGGTPSYSYQWYVNNSPIGIGGQGPTLGYTTGTSAFRIQVFVTDALGAQANDSKIISVSSGFNC